MKAILVIDMPESCTSCLLGIYNKKWFCLKTLKDIDITDRYHIPKWCPLKPMPNKKEGKKEFGWNCCEYTKFTEFEDGWNDCIKEIEK